MQACYVCLWHSNGVHTMHMEIQMVRMILLCLHAILSYSRSFDMARLAKSGIREVSL